MEKSREDRNPGYADQGEWRACPVVLGRRRRKTGVERVRPRREGTWMVPAGGCPQAIQAHIHELTLTDIGPCWVPFVLDVS